MDVYAKHNYALISPQKARRVIRLVKGKKAVTALALLKTIPHYKGARLIYKVLNSAIANAVNNHGMNKDKLLVSVGSIDEGPRAKRLLPRAFGRAHIKVKRYSHITLAVKEVV